MHEPFTTTDLKYRFKHYFTFTSDEYRHLLITAVVAGFILSFRKWGIEQFNFVIGVTNLVLAICIAFGSLYIHIFFQKLCGLKVGYFPKYRSYPTLLGIGFLLTVFTNGLIPFFPPGCISYDINERMRLGKLRKGYTTWEASLVSFAGPLANIFIAEVLGFVYLIAPSDFLFSVIAINLLVALYAMLPIPQIIKPSKKKLAEAGGMIVTGTNPLYNLELREGGPAGLFVFIHHRGFFVLTFCLTLFYSGLVLSVNLFSLILAIFMSLVTAIAYYYLVEQG